MFGRIFPISSQGSCAFPCLSSHSTFPPYPGGPAKTPLPCPAPPRSRAPVLTTVSSCRDPAGPSRHRRGASPGKGQLLYHSASFSVSSRAFAPPVQGITYLLLHCLQSRNFLQLRALWACSLRCGWYLEHGRGAGAQLQWPRDSPSSPGKAAQLRCLPQAGRRGTDSTKASASAWFQEKSSQLDFLSGNWWRRILLTALAAVKLK